jgi:hypothetical protein
VKDNGLQWDPANPSAKVWVDSNISSLCAGTPAMRYPIDCFAAGIRQGLPWQASLGLCQYDPAGCTFQSALQFNLVLSADGSYSGPDGSQWDAIIRHCAFGEQLVAISSGVSPGIFLGECSKSASETFWFSSKLDQNEVTSLCSMIEATKAPASCIGEVVSKVQNQDALRNGLRDSNGNPIAFPSATINGGPDYARSMTVSLCSASLDAETTANCFQAGVTYGYDLGTVVEVCRAKPENFANIQLGNPSLLPSSTLRAMGNNCVTRNSINNDGSVDLARGWNACVNQPLFY